MTRFMIHLSVPCVALLLGACGALPPPTVPPSLHDFGLPSVAQRATATATAPVVDIVVEAVSAPSWLADTQIHYRLLYDEPTHLRAYAQNQWVAPPAELLRQRLQLAFDPAGSGAANAARQSRVRLRLQLLDFEQVFESASSASVTLQAFASMRAADNQVLAEHLFNVTVAASPDVQGALHGSTEAAERLGNQIVRWSGRHIVVRANH